MFRLTVRKRLLLQVRRHRLPSVSPTLNKLMHLISGSKVCIPSHSWYSNLHIFLAGFKCGMQGLAQYQVFSFSFSLAGSSDCINFSCKLMWLSLESYRLEPQILRTVMVIKLRALLISWKSWTQIVTPFSGWVTLPGQQALMRSKCFLDISVKIQRFSRRKWVGAITWTNYFRFFLVL